MHHYRYDIITQMPHRLLLLGLLVLFNFGMQPLGISLFEGSLDQNIAEGTLQSAVTVLGPLIVPCGSDLNLCRLFL